MTRAGSRAAPLTRAQVIERLRGLAARDGSTSAHWISRHDPVTYRGVLAHFDSIAAARTAARIPAPQRKRRWSRARVIAELRRLARQRAFRITAQGLNRVGYAGLLNAVRTYVGSLPRARRLAGLPDPPVRGGKRERWDDDRVIAEIRRRRRANQPLAVTKVPSKLVSAACTYCGSWREAIEMAGLDYAAVRLSRAPWRKDEILAALRTTEKAKRAGIEPARLGTVVSRVAKRWFGDVRSAAVVAGLDPAALLRRRSLTKQEIDAGMRSLSRERPAMTITELRRTNLGAAAEHRYGSIRRALDQLHIKDWPGRISLPSRENLVRRERWDPVRVLDAVRSRHRDGRSLAVSKVPASLASAAASLFGSWETAIENAGLDYNAIRLVRAPWSRADVISAIRASARSNRTGVGPDGFVSVQIARAARRLFGSLEAAIIAAGGDPTRVQRRQRRTDRQIAAELRKLARDKPAMTITELHDSNIGMTAAHRYGGLSAALQALRIRNWPRRLRLPLPSRRELIQALQHRHRRREPMGQNAIVDGEPRLLKAAYKHFGTWRAAMTAAGLGALVGLRGQPTSRARRR